jgi:arabinofuranosyltransferase
VGLLGYAAGQRVYIADVHGLANPIASHTRIEQVTFPDGRVKIARPKAGHDKEMSREWVAARFGQKRPYSANPISEAWLTAARHALRCGPLRRLLEAENVPLTFSRFFSNVAHSISYTRLRFSPNPIKAEASVCGQADRRL